MSARVFILIAVLGCGGWLNMITTVLAAPTALPSATPTPAVVLPAMITGTIPVESEKSATPPALTESSAAPEHEPAEEHKAKSPAHPPVEPMASTPSLDQQSLVHQKVLDQLSGQLQVAQRAAAAGDSATAEQAYQRLLTLPASAAEKRDALMKMASYYKEGRQHAKAAVVYEKILALFPEDPANPDLYFELGRIYRDAGLYDLAISRFYSVLNSAISQNDGQEETRARRNLSLLARFEIAEASYAKGDYAAASKFYSRLQLLELPTADRPTVAFKNAQSIFQIGDYTAAAAALREFIDQFPAAARTPEARNLLARAYQKQKRPREATEAVLALLRQEKKAGDNGDLTHWQKETGRQVASQFYEEGDYRSAATIYQTLATLDSSADWQWPIVYEIGLCFERLNLPDRAREAYAYLQRPPASGKGTKVSDAPLPPALEAIRGMAKWRQEHLAWQQGNDAQLQALLGPTRKATESLPASDAPASASSPASPPAPSAATPLPLSPSAASPSASKPAVTPLPTATMAPRSR